jgi:hypothetical protein
MINICIVKISWASHYIKGYYYYDKEIIVNKSSLNILLVLIMDVMYDYILIDFKIDFIYNTWVDLKFFRYGEGVK